MPAPAVATTVHTVVETPIGQVTLVAADGALTALYMEVHRHAPEAATFGPRDDEEPVLVEAHRQLEEYFAGDRTDFDLPIHLIGTPFRQTVWAALQEIPYGETWSYGRLAAHIGTPAASRAVGLANGRNPVSIIVPCHRVVGADGSMTGYGGGLERKVWLLGHERRVSGQSLL